jgi:methyl-accepting chemotaxis protein
MKNLGAFLAAAMVLMLAMGTASSQDGSGNISKMVQQLEEAAKEASGATEQVESAAKQLQNMTNATPGAEAIAKAAKMVEEKAEVAGEMTTKAEEAAKKAAEAAEQLPTSTPGFGFMAAALGLLSLAFISLRKRS